MKNIVQIQSNGKQMLEVGNASAGNAVVRTGNLVQMGDGDMEIKIGNAHSGSTTVILGDIIQAGTGKNKIDIGNN